jgi:hypothetical protein
MSDLIEFQALAESIGSMALAEIGRESVKTLEVVVDPVDFSAHVTIVPREGSNVEQRRMIEAMFEVEKIFSDEVTITYIFADALLRSKSSSRRLAFTA